MSDWQYQPTGRPAPPRERPAGAPPPMREPVQEPPGAGAAGPAAAPAATPVPPSPAAPAGGTAGAAELPPEFEFVRPLGGGALAEVSLCWERTTGRSVAIKMLRPHLPDERARLGLQTELLAAGVAALHPCAVPVEDVWFDHAGRACLLMAACTGGSAKARLASAGPLPVDEVLVLGVRVTAALRYAHRRGVLHLDVRPANVLADDTGEWFLADHGIARAVSRAAPGHGVVFDPVYAPRELFGWEAPGPGCDTYGLGATMYALLAGAPAHAEVAGLGPAARYAAILSGELPPPRPDVPPPLYDLLRRMMAPNPEGRPALTEVDRLLRMMLPNAHAGRVPVAEPDADGPGGTGGEGRLNADTAPGDDDGFEPTPAGRAAARRATEESRRGPGAPLLLAGVAAAIMLVVAMVGLLLSGRGDNQRQAGPEPTAPASSAPAVSAVPLPSEERKGYLATRVRARRDGQNVLVSWRAPSLADGISGYLVVAQSTAGELQTQQAATDGQVNVVFTIPPVRADSCFVVTTLVSRDAGVQFARGKPVCLNGS